MKPCMYEFRNKRVTVAGLGRFGGQIAAIKWLVEQGARVLVTDKEPAEKLAESVNQLENLPIHWRLGEHRLEDFVHTDLVVTSPAIPPHSQFLRAARQAQVPITTEIQLFIERCPARILAVTGTKGKSTTTAMLGRMLATRHTTHVGGNIGKPLVLELPNIKKTDLVVLEISSFMLEYLRAMEWSPHVAVVTMLAVDHVEWHGSAEAYIDAKKLIVRHQRPGDYAVLAESTPHTDELAQTTRAKVVRFNATGRRFDLLVPGEHNQFNSQAAFTAASIFGVTWQEAQDALKDFRGLPHRLQLVHEESGIRYFNDSIATVPQAAIAALESFPPNRVLQIVGGYDKGLSFTEMCIALSHRAKAVLCIGKTGPKIGDLVRRAPGPAVHQCENLEAAMKLAKELAAPGDVVLLSTGCASYDQFANFEHRGRQFADLAQSRSLR
jgi:UDP-N-acetylmuramoylalanine--D-glutamate ligase